MDLSPIAAQVEEIGMHLLQLWLQLFLTQTPKKSISTLLLDRVVQWKHHVSLTRICEHLTIIPL